MDKVILNRIATLLDELLHRGVPANVLQPVIDWLMDQTHSQLGGRK